MTDSPPFEWSPDEIRRIGYRVVDMIAEHLGGIADKPVFAPYPPDLAQAALASSLPQEGQSPDDILDQLARTVAQHPFGNGHPRFYGWVNSPPAVIAVFAEAMAAAMNPSVAGGNHGVVWVEREVLEWFKQLLGFPHDSMGLLVSGGSAAAITALSVARYAACASRGWNVRAAGVQRPASPGDDALLVVYKSGEGHGCNEKAVELLGLGSAQIRTVAVDAKLRMDVASLDRMIAEDLAAGNIPVAVVASEAQ